MTFSENLSSEMEGKYCWILLYLFSQTGYLLVNSYYLSSRSWILILLFDTFDDRFFICRVFYTEYLLTEWSWSMLSLSLSILWASAILYCSTSFISFSNGFISGSGDGYLFLVYWALSFYFSFAFYFSIFLILSFSKSFESSKRPIGVQIDTLGFCWVFLFIFCFKFSSLTLLTLRFDFLCFNRDSFLWWLALILLYTEESQRIDFSCRLEIWVATLACLCSDRNVLECGEWKLECWYFFSLGISNLNKLPFLWDLLFWWCFWFKISVFLWGYSWIVLFPTQ